MPKSEHAAPPPNTAPYVSFSTFKAFIQRLHETALPSVIDGSLMTTYSGATQSHLRTALRFLKLITPSGSVTDRMRALVAAFGTEQWNEALSDVVFEAYLEVIDKVDLDTGTYSQLREAFRARGNVDGQSVEKAIRFYLTAVQDTGTSMSPHFSTRGVRTAGRGASTPRRRTKKVAPETPPAAKTPTHAHGPAPRAPENCLLVPFPLRADLVLQLVIPLGLTKAEVDRITALYTSYAQS